MSALIRRALMPSLLVLGLAVVSSPALAQTGQVKGKVVDAKTQPVEKAQVTIEATDGMGRKFNVTTNRRGEYVQIGLLPGQYKITASLCWPPGPVKQSRPARPQPVEKQRSSCSSTQSPSAAQGAFELPGRATVGSS